MPQKPEKHIDDSKSFRTIALLTPIARLTEKLLLKDFIEYPLKKYQHGFRPDHSTAATLNIVSK